MKKTRFFIFVFPLLLLLITLYFLTNCTSIGWLDDGSRFLCPECKDKYVLLAIGTCEKCEGSTSSVSYKYCYDCAKEMNKCQMCRRNR